MTPIQQLKPLALSDADVTPPIIAPEGTPPSAPTPAVPPQEVPASAVPPQEVPPQQIMLQIMGGQWLARAVSTAASLGLADLIGDEPKTVEQLAAASETHAPSLYRLLRALAGSGIFREDESGRFSATPLSDTLRSNVPGSMRASAMSIMGGEHYQAWGDLLHSVKTGETAFDYTFGMPVWDFFAQHPQSGAVFNDAMTEITKAVDAAVVGSYDFAGINRIVDVGGGHGSLVTSILQANPQVRGVVFDQPQVVEGARTQIESSGLGERCHAIGGDFFNVVPEGGDAYIMKFIIHDWDDERAHLILRNCRRAIQPNGKLLLVELLVPAGNEPSFATLCDLNMLVMTGGKERTEAEYRALYAAAGFRLTRIIPTPSPMSIIEGEPI